MILKGYNLKDTIAAIATFPSKSALGVIKISGQRALPIVSKVFKPARKKNIQQAKNYTLHYGWIIEKTKRLPAGRQEKRKAKNETTVDEVLVSIMKAPRSYTKEDVAEISAHGGAVALNKILGMLIKQGARLARPGEFTYRALVAGRIDLLQAESISGIVDARTDAGLTLAAAQLRGEASSKIKALKEEVKALFIRTESAINFPEDVAIPAAELKTEIKSLKLKIDALVKASAEAKIIREGLKCVICGKTNAGKSTLFNRLLKEERVIVSKSPGTTRDVIEETIIIRGVPLRIYDTAGIYNPRDLVARRALDKTSEIFTAADLVILVLDGSRPLSKDDFFLLDKIKNKNSICVINKIDLPQRLSVKSIFKNSRGVKMSALKNIGLGDLEKAVYNNVYRIGFSRENIIFLNHYQRQVLKEAARSIGEIGIFLKEKRPVDFINFALKECLDNLGKITGEVFCAEILESMFSRFCIGK